MRTRRLGSQGPELTVIGFGCWAMGGAGWAGSWGPQDDEESIRSIHTALDAGVNWFDTAAVYGLGHSEEVLGKALGPRRPEVVVATKFGTVWDSQGNLSDRASYESVMRECDASLRRLGTDYIDLYQQHWPDREGTPVEETMRALDDLVQAGKVRYTGVSNYDLPLLQQALAVRHVDSLQPQYNLFSRGVESELLPYCREHGVGVVAYSPLHSGLLGGTYTPDKRFDDGDWRVHNPDFTGEGLRRNLERVDQLRRIADRSGHTVAQLAVAWVLSNPALTAAIVGVRRPSHITGILPAGDWELDEDTRQTIEQIMQPEQAGIGS
ncbi:MAG TPA: aldo/keto reductase [Chloroflexota bacterium]|nr:aldo/keto reductase [Chloroflexota bacterium]